MNEDYNKPVELEEDTGAGKSAEPPIETVPQKKTLARRIADALMSEDYRILFGSIYQNIIAPAIKRIAVEAFREFVYRGKGQYDAPDEPRNYQVYYDEGSGRRGSEEKLRRNYAEIQFKNIDSAERVLAKMRSKLKTDKIVLVADYFKMANMRPEYSYYDYGWTDLSTARIYHYNVKGERVWSIHLPEPMPFERTR